MELAQHFKNYLMQALVVPSIVPSGHANTSTIQTRVLSTSRSLTMHIVLLALALIATLASPAHAQNAATSIAKDATQASKTARLSIDALCAQLTLDEVTAIVGKNFERRPEKEKLYQSCTYGDNKEKGQLRVRHFSLSNSILKEAGWRKFVESDAKGKIIERDGVLVSHLRRNKFGTDSIWFKDRQGRELELHVNSGVTENQAVALAKAAID
jgi:hypothetical protein